eukprot:TRINITY_DN3562_c0_g1_i4.p1 TRINITY_DN3562_c0_g1~~TRINITY_DN3562_c0_g1_i4.p1  ORF type:complete len:207 (+),score=46.43 TRINITY_DN3562_c0_g1_i4:1035-1655(+)
MPTLAEVDMVGAGMKSQLGKLEKKMDQIMEFYQSLVARGGGTEPTPATARYLRRIHSARNSASGASGAEQDDHPANTTADIRPPSSLSSGVSSARSVSTPTHRVPLSQRSTATTASARLRSPVIPPRSVSSTGRSAAITTTTAAAAATRPVIPALKTLPGAGPAVTKSAVSKPVTAALPSKPPAAAVGVSSRLSAARSTTTVTKKT